MSGQLFVPSALVKAHSHIRQGQDLANKGDSVLLPHPDSTSPSLLPLLLFLLLPLVLLTNSSLQPRRAS